MTLPKIKIRHLRQNQILIWIIALTPFVILPATIYLGFPSFFKYIADLCWAFLGVTMMVKRKKVANRNVSCLRYFVIYFFVLSLLLYIINYQSIFYYLWGLRNNLRFYILFLAVILYFKEEDIESYFSFLDKFFVLEILALSIQFFVFHMQQDQLGGIFGNASGCNGFLNLFFCIYLAILYIRYTYAEIGLVNFGVRSVLMLAFAGCAEIKFFYVEFVIIIAIATLITRFSFKKLFIIIAAIFIFFVGYRALITVFPDSAFTIESLLAIGTDTKGYTASGDMNRLYFISTINTRFLTNPFRVLFGLGMGNCDYAEAFGFVTSSFYSRYGWMHYSWLSTAHMYLENGIVGLIFLFGFFILNIVFGFKNSSMLKKDKYWSIINKIAILCSFIGIMSLIYNNSLRTEAGYMLYIILAFPYVLISKNRESDV